MRYIIGLLSIPTFIYTLVGIIYYLLSHKYEEIIMILMKPIFILVGISTFRSHEPNEFGFKNVCL